MSRKTKIKNIEKHIELHRCPRTGIAWVENGRSGIGHSAHPNIDKTGSIAGMKKLGYWDKNARTVETHGFIYNIDLLSVSDEYDRIASDNCLCAACLERRFR